MSVFRFSFPSIAAVTLLTTFSTGTAEANDRHFTFIHESAVLNPGAAEIEPWTTWRIGREGYYSRFDQRLEFELGLTHRLQAAFYLNATGLARDVSDGVGGLVRVTSLDLGSASTEFKYKLSDPVADALGSALYLEFTGSPTELEVEGKLIVDKQVGKTLFAANLVGEREWKLEGPDETEIETKLELVGGLAYLVSPHLSLGIELRNHNYIEGGEWANSALFAGPTLAFANKGGWLAFSVLPQLPAIKKEDGDDLRELHDHEKVMVRLLLGFDL